MKTLKRIFSVLFVISLCAVPLSCARQTAEPERSAPERTKNAWFLYPSAAWPTEPPTVSDETSEPESSAEETAPVTAKPKKKPKDRLAAFEEEALRLTNEERAAAGLAPLAFSAELQRYARIRAVELLEDFSHTRPDGQSCFSLNPELIMGENIAMGQETPREAVNSWLDSPSHREIILLERFTVSAVGVCYNQANGMYYWVQLFGEEEPSEPGSAGS